MSEEIEREIDYLTDMLSQKDAEISELEWQLGECQREIRRLRNLVKILEAKENAAD